MIGVLALQGDAPDHLRALARRGESPREVRGPGDLEGLTHLVLPGGESSTQSHLLDLFGLRDPLVERFRAGRLALFGTCAGAILLGRGPGPGDPEPGDPEPGGADPGRAGAGAPPRSPRPLELLDAVLVRNAYGRQVDSFARDVELVPGVSTAEATGASTGKADAAAAAGRGRLPAVFIRAPRITALGPGVRVLARDGDDPVLVEAPGILAATFHPELAGDPWVYDRFLEGPVGAPARGRAAGPAVRR